MESKIYHYLMCSGHVRLFAAQTTDTVQRARDIHGLSATATAAVGRTMTIAGIMASDMKTQGSITLNLRGEGPAGALTVVAWPGVGVKAYVQNPHIDTVPKRSGKLDVGAYIGPGRLSVVRDMGMGEPWVGQVDIQTGEIAEDMAYYFSVSEQLPSLVALGVLVGADVTVLAAGGLLAQPLPGCPVEHINSLEAAAANLGDTSRDIHALGGVEALVEEKFGHLGVEKVGETPVAWRCDCSQERIERALISLGVEELSDMIDRDGGAEVSCHFCLKKYGFTAAELDALRREAAAK